MRRRDLLRAGTFAAAATLLGCRNEDTAPPAATPRPERERPRDADPSAPQDTAPDQLDPEPPDAEPEPEPPDEDPEPEPTPVSQLDVLCRDALGLAAATAGGTEHRIERVTLHHTAVALERNALAPSRLRGHQTFHQQQGWPDIAYHYGVDLAGNTYELRRPDLAGDTFTDYDPSGHLLLLCEGNYDEQDPTDEQLARLSELLAYAIHAYGVAPADLSGHRDHAATSCPGDRLQARLPQIAAEAQRLAEGHAFELAVQCDEEARQRVASIEGGG